uniref:Uncharacterized protein n=1 Tax=Lepeophtheirus salmonis TaxID=72036 RepID=A0A0K2V5E7_LEPSM
MLPFLQLDLKRI